MILFFHVVALPAAPPGDPSLETALSAIKWIDHQKQGLPTTWPSRTGLPLEELCDLYYGNSGTILFYFEMYKQTGDSAYLDIAKAGAAFLEERLPNIPTFGFYDGLAGVAFSLTELSRVLPELRPVANRAVDRLIQNATHTAAGLEWNHYNDLMGGTAGIGIVLLSLSQSLDRPELVGYARSAGDHLLTTRIRTDQGSH